MSRQQMPREAAIAANRWFVLDDDQLIHRHHASADRALCGHAWIAPLWESSIGRNDFRWRPDCQRAISRLKEASRASRPFAFKQLPQRNAAFKRLQQRNAKMAKALADDLPGLRAEWAQRSRSLGAPGTGKRR